MALTRKKGESIMINNDIEISILEIRGDQIKIGISAPKDVPVYRKEVYNQMKANGKVEMCGMNKGTWIRVKGVVKEDTRREARVAMMEENKKSLQSMYTVDDNLMTVFAFESGSATVYSFTEEPKVINL